MKVTIQHTTGIAEVDATPHTIEGCQVVSHRNHVSPRRWTVSEPRCGLAVGHGDTRKEALESARRAILQYGADTFEASVQSALRDKPLTPTPQ